jgi:hypothetical protein
VEFGAEFWLAASPGLILVILVGAAEEAKPAFLNISHNRNKQSGLFNEFAD